MTAASLAIVKEPPAAQKILENAADRMKGVIGPPWAAAPRSNPVFAKRTPMDDFLDKLGAKGDSRNDFAAATFALVKGAKGKF